MKKSKALQTSKAKRIQCHQISFATNAKGTSLCGKHKRKGEKEGNKKDQQKTNPKQLRKC